MSRNTRWVVLFLALLLIWVGSSYAEVIRGKVTNMDLKGNRVSLQSKEGKDYSFTFDPQDFIVWKGDDEVKADEIKTGAEAEVGYYADETGREIASWVDLTPAEEGEEEVTVPEAAAPAPAAQPAAASATQEHAGTEMPAKEHPGTTE
ncbi:MAG: hypothetical protein HY590_02710 [Candidatus Omnitrophica bacterium]|nr:hypothetical protein [Candidatus Omnitrophota bacterium]